MDWKNYLRIFVTLLKTLFLHQKTNRGSFWFYRGEQAYLDTYLDKYLRIYPRVCEVQN